MIEDEILKIKKDGANEKLKREITNRLAEIIDKSRTIGVFSDKETILITIERIALILEECTDLANNIDEEETRDF